MDQQLIKNRFNIIGNSTALNHALNVATQVANTDLSVLINGESGGAFNPSRMFGPAIISGTWDYLWLYWIAQFLGAAMAGLLVHNVHRFGIDLKSSTNDVSAEEAARNVQRTRALGNSADVARNNETTTFNVLK